MKTELKLCKDCAWSSCALGVWTCNRNMGKKDPVSGASVKCDRHCVQERMEGECGYCARFHKYEEPGLLKRFMVWLTSL